MTTYIEKIFYSIDNLLSLNKFSVFDILVVSYIFTFIVSLIILYKIISIFFEESNIIQKRKELSLIILTSYVVTLIFMIFGFAASFYELTVDILFILGLIMFVISINLHLIYMLIFKENPPYERLLILLLWNLVYLILFFYSAKPLLNGIDATETTTDTLQIYIAGHWAFSRHAGWYDLAPVDSIIKVYLLHVTGINNPYDPVTTSLVFFASALALFVFLVAFFKKFFYKTFYAHIIAILTLSIHPYSPITQLSVPPVNLALQFSMFTLLIITNTIFNNQKNLLPTFLVYSIFVFSAILAHPISIIVPIYIFLAIISFMSIKNLLLIRSLFNYFIIFLILFLVKLAFTAMLPGVITFSVLLSKALEFILNLKFKTDIVAYQGSPNLPPLSTFFSFTAFIGFISAVVVVEIFRAYKYKNYNKIVLLNLLFSLIFTGLSFALNQILSFSRYLAIPAITLSSFISMIYISYLISLPSNSVWKYMLFFLISITALLTLFSPNAIIEQYNIFTGGRWARIENFILSKIIVYNVDQHYVENTYYGTNKTMLYIYFYTDILYYGHPYHQIDVLFVERFLIPGIINAKSYWDAYNRYFITYGGYLHNSMIGAQNIVLNGWKWIVVWGSSHP